jgi:dopamine beta-monooxygenase
VHYNNPELIAGIVDSSGYRLKLVDQLRKYDSAVIELGVEYTTKMAVPPGELAFIWSGFCTFECTNAALPPDGITIIGSELHTHGRGVRGF